MFLQIRTKITNTPGRGGVPFQPVRLPYLSDYAFTLRKPGDTAQWEGHLESKDMRKPHRQALKQDVARGVIDLEHEIQIGDKWYSLDAIALLVAEQSPESIKASADELYARKQQVTAAHAAEAKRLVAEAEAANRAAIELENRVKAEAEAQRVAAEKAEAERIARELEEAEFEAELRAEEAAKNTQGGAQTTEPSGDKTASLEEIDLGEDAVGDDDESDDEG